MINESVIKGQWKVIKGDLQRRWGVLTTDDLDKAKGDVSIIESVLIKKLGISQEKAHEQLDSFLKKYDTNSVEEDSFMNDNDGEADNENKNLY